MRKLCEDCQEETDHFGDVCLECYYLTDSEDDSEHKSDREFINDESESDYESDSDDN